MNVRILLCIFLLCSYQPSVRSGDLPIDPVDELVMIPYEAGWLTVMSLFVIGSVWLFNDLTDIDELVKE